MIIKALPLPDKFGNHWFGKPGCPNAPVIMKIKEIPHKKEKYLLSFGGRGGIVTDDTGVRAFDSPGAAFLHYLRHYPIGTTQ